jgi:hypothetical protein
VAIMLSREEMLKTLLKLLNEDDKYVQIEILHIFTNLGDNCGQFDIEQFYVDKEIISSLVELLKIDDSLDIVKSAL